MKLSKRMNALFNLIEKCDSFADVGCDHGYLSIAVCEASLAKKIIACDINKGPLEKAAENIKHAGFEGQIETRLGNGLSPILPNEIDGLLIAGMGGPLMCEIIKSGWEVFNSLSYAVLQPQSDIGSFRRFIYDNGFSIDAEDMILEDDKYYPMMRVKKGKASKLNDIEYLYGPILLNSKNETLYAYLKKENEQLNFVLKQLENCNDKKRKDDVKKQLALNEQALALF